MELSTIDFGAHVWGHLSLSSSYGQQDLNPQGFQPLGPKPSVSTNSTMSAAMATHLLNATDPFSCNDKPQLVSGRKVRFIWDLFQDDSISVFISVFITQLNRFLGIDLFSLCQLGIAILYDRSRNDLL